MFSKLLATMTLVAMSNILPSVPAMASTPAASFSVQPAPASDGGARDYFRLRADPGNEVHDRLVVRNLGDSDLDLQLGAVDAATGPLGGASYGIAGSPTQVTGSWISLSATSVVVGPGSSESVDVRVAVPAGAASGQHLAAIAVGPSLGDTTSVGSAGMAASIRLDTRRVIAVEVVVPGPTEAELAVTGAHVAARPSGLFVQVNVTNRGNALTTAEGTIEISSLGFRQEFSVGTFVPGTSIRYPLKLAGKVPDGSHATRVELRYGAKMASWEGEVVIGDREAAELRRRQVDVPSGISSRPGTPWLVVAVVAIVGGVGLGLGVGATLWFSRRRSERR